MDLQTQSGAQWDIPVDVSVVDSEGTDLGKVVEARPGMIVVEKGRLFPSELYIPRAAIATFDGERVQLAVTKDDARDYRWDQEPGTEAHGDAFIADPFVPGGASGVGTGAPGYVDENPRGDEQMSGTSNQPSTS